VSSIPVPWEFVPREFHPGVNSSEDDCIGALNGHSAFCLAGALRLRFSFLLVIRYSGSSFSAFGDLDKLDEERRVRRYSQPFLLLGTLPEAPLVRDPPSSSLCYPCHSFPPILPEGANDFFEFS